MALFKKKPAAAPAPAEKPAAAEKTYGSKVPVVEPDRCTACRACLYLCKNGVFDKRPQLSYPGILNEDQCEDGCTLCADRCRTHAISFRTR